jgi:hypothetical protein
MVVITRLKAWWWSSRWSNGYGDHYDYKSHTIHNLIWSYTCLGCLLSCLTILFALYMWWMFYHDGIAYLRKVEFLCHLPIAAPIEFWSLCGGFDKANYPQLSLWIVQMPYIHKYSICLLIKAIKRVLCFMAWSWEPRHWMSPDKQESYRYMINNYCLCMSLIFQHWSQSSLEF